MLVNRKLLKYVELRILVISDEDFALHCRMHDCPGSVVLGLQN
jgi:hypothetical protein